MCVICTALCGRVSTCVHNRVTVRECEHQHVYVFTHLLTVTTYLLPGTQCSC